jgi:hypothetical protein
MSIKDWKLTVVFLCGLGVCVAGFGGLARRLNPHTPASPRALAVEVAEAEEDDWEEILFFPECVEEEA